MAEGIGGGAVKLPASPEDILVRGLHDPISTRRGQEECGAPHQRAITPATRQATPDVGREGLVPRC